MLTPLHSACEGGQLEVVRELLDRGANIEATAEVCCSRCVNLRIELRRGGAQEALRRVQD